MWGSEVHRVVPRSPPPQFRIQFVHRGLLYVGVVAKTFRRSIISAVGPGSSSWRQIPAASPLGGPGSGSRRQEMHDVFSFVLGCSSPESSLWSTIVAMHIAIIWVITIAITTERCGSWGIERIRRFVAIGRRGKFELVRQFWCLPALGLTAGGVGKLCRFIRTR